MTKAREFIDFWIANSVHAAERLRTPGASQDVAELALRCIKAAKGQGISTAEIEAEIDDLAMYIRIKLEEANNAEHNRQRPGS